MVREARNQYMPDIVSPPGDTLMETLEAISMSQAELAQRTGKSKKTINEIIKGKAALTTDTALQLERVLGIPASFWNNRERLYRENLAKREEEHNLKKMVNWLKNFPLKDMVRLGWVRGFRDRVQQLRELLNFFGVASIEQLEGLWPIDMLSSFDSGHLRVCGSHSIPSVPEDSTVLHCLVSPSFPDLRRSLAFRRSRAYQSNRWAISAWLRQGEIEAKQISCASYDPEKFKLALREIRSLTKEEPEIFQAKMKDFCAEAGVAVVFTPEIPGTGVCGASRWLNPKKALIQLSLRYKTDDHLWFSFYHEAGHILLHSKRTIFIDADRAGNMHEDIEIEANKFAENTLIPPSNFRLFLKNKKISKQSVRDFAEDIGISPGVVVGRLQHEGKLFYTQFYDLKKRFEWSLD